MNYDQFTNLNCTAVMIYTDDCISAHSLNIFTIPSELETLEYFLSFKMIHCFLQTHFGNYEQFVGHLCNVFKFFNVCRPLWNGIEELRTLFRTYRQFVGHLCNVFRISNVRRSLWNGTQYYLLRM